MNKQASIACIFDMDGLLFDSERLCMNVWQEIAVEKGYVVPDSLFYKCVGRNLKDTSEIVVNALGAEFPYEEFRKISRERISAYIETNGPPVKPGISELFTYLKNENILCALATSSGEKSARFMLEKAGIISNFAAFSFGSEVEHGKPEPDIFLNAAKRLGVAPAICVVYEDSEPGLIAAKAAGMKSIFIKDMVEPSKAVLETVDYKVSSLDKSIPIIKQLTVL